MSPDLPSRAAARLHGGPVGACPACGGTEFVLVDNGEEVNFLCPACDRCWHHSMGWVVRSDPAACPSCPWSERCSRRFDADALARR
jgi:hypothetical protein